MTAALRRRLSALEAAQDSADAGPAEVALYFQDAGGIWRDNQIGEALPSESEQAARRIFAIKVVACRPA